jgi:hypothetical protein
VAQEKDGSQLDRSREKLSITKSRKKETYYILKNVTERKTQQKRRQGRRH